MKIKIVDREVLHEDVHMFLSRFRVCVTWLGACSVSRERDRA